MHKKECIILGGGISGLTTAWFLKKAGVPFKLFEKKTHTGGVILSKSNGESVMDFGPNSLRDRNGKIRQLAIELGLEKDVIQISEAFKTRYIVKNGKLRALSPKLASLLSTDIISTRGKFRALCEPFITKGKRNDESLGHFLERRIGKEAVEYLADPVFSGIYAGDIYEMSRDEILPKLAQFEQEFGSISWGAIRSKREKKSVKPTVLSFRKGIQQLTDALTVQLADHIFYEEVKSIQEVAWGYEIATSRQSYAAETVISCLPAHALSDLTKSFDFQFSDMLKSIDYAPMASVQLLFSEDAVKMPKAGFGFLIPRKENYRLLGAIWKSSIFPELTSPGKLQFTLMAGGAHDRKVLNESSQNLEEELIKEFSALMDISEKPELVESKVWKQAIPQFEVGYASRKNEMKEAEERHPGFHVGGNIRWGIAVPECVEGAENLSQKVIKS